MDGRGYKAGAAYDFTGWKFDRVTRKRLLQTLLGVDYDHLYCKDEECANRTRAQGKLEMLDAYLQQERRDRKCEHASDGPQTQNDTDNSRPEDGVAN